MSDILREFDKIANVYLPEGFRMDSDVIELSDFSYIVSSKLFYTADRTSDLTPPDKIVVLTFHPDAMLPLFKFKVLQKGIESGVLKHLKKIILNSYKAAVFLNSRSDNYKIVDEINNKVKKLTQEIGDIK